MKRLDIFYNCSKFIQSWLYPPRCSLCGSPGDDDYDLCRPCRNALPYNHHPCQQCGLPLATGEALLCGRCLKKPPPHERAVIPFLYAAPLAHLILALKYHQGLAHARLLGALLADAVQASSSRPQLIIPVPLHLRRLRERGYNQAVELARPVAARLQLPLALGEVQRIRHTESQTRLDYKARHKNLRGVFTVQGQLPSHVAVVDDVVTSGSTLRELSSTLKHSGVKHIDIWAVARASLRR